MSGGPGGSGLLARRSAPPFEKGRRLAIQVLSSQSGVEIVVGGVTVCIR